MKYLEVNHQYENSNIRQNSVRIGKQIIDEFSVQLITKLQNCNNDDVLKKQNKTKQTHGKISEVIKLSREKGPKNANIFEELTCLIMNQIFKII